MEGQWRRKIKLDNKSKRLLCSEPETPSIEPETPNQAHRPMKLYVSALSGGGLSINSPFMGEMKKAAEAFETNYESLDSEH